MKKNIKGVALLFCIAFTMSSCYTYQFTVGEGSQTGIEYQKKNHYFIYGLAAGEQADFREMAGDTQDYEVTIKHSFIDGLINGLTFGIYTPTTTTVRK
jgi:hypothetical protein